MLHSSGSVAVNNARFDGDIEQVSKNRNGIIVASRGYGFAIGPGPFSAIGLCDLADFGFVQASRPARPAFLKGKKALAPVMARARFNAEIVVEIAQMNRSGFAECHFGRDFAVAVADALAMLFEKFRELGLCYAEM